MKLSEMSSKDLYKMIGIDDRRTKEVILARYKTKDNNNIDETCGLIRLKEIKATSKKMISIKYNRKEILSLLKIG